MTASQTASATETFTPLALRGRSPQPAFIFKVPTWADKDDINLLIYRSGVRSVSTEQIRAVVISECERLLGAEKGAEAATFFDGHWQLQEMEEIAHGEWWEQEEQRLIDRAGGASEEDAPQAPKPQPLTTIQGRARAAMLMQEIIDNSDRVRDMLADQQDYERRYDMLVFRLQCVGLVNFKTKLERDDSGLITPECVEAIRTEIDNIGWDKVTGYAKAMYDLTESERKNFDSPPENISDQSGLPTTKDE